MLPGDLIAYLLRQGRRSLTAGTAAAPPERERGSLDPQTVAEFLAYDLPFETPPAMGFVFPTGTNRD